MERRKDNKGRVLKEGESQRKDGRYQYRWTDCYGKRRSIYANDLKSLRDNEEDVFKSSLLQIKYDESNITLIELAWQYHSIRINALRERTLKKEEGFLHRAVEYQIAHRKIKDITTLEAKKWAISLQENGKKFGTINGEKKLFSSAFKMAIKDRKVLSNPFDFDLKGVIKDDSERRKALSKEEFDSIIDFVSKSNVYKRYYDIIIILSETGIRVSELCGLTLDDVDLSSGKIKITKQLVGSTNKNIQIAPPKTEAGYRIVPLTKKATKSICNIVNNRGIMNFEPCIDGVTKFLLLNNNATPMTSWDIQSGFLNLRRAYMKKYGINQSFSAHILRHTFCTNMIRCGMNVKEVQYLMGHKKTTTTLNVYSHVDEQSIAEKINNIDGLC